MKILNYRSYLVIFPNELYVSEIRVAEPKKEFDFIKINLFELPTTMIVPKGRILYEVSEGQVLMGKKGIGLEH